MAPFARFELATHGLGIRLFGEIIQFFNKPHCAKLRVFKQVIQIKEISPLIGNLIQPGTSTKGSAADWILIKTLLVSNYFIS